MDRRSAYLLAALGALGLVAVIALQYLRGPVLRGFANGKLEQADYWRDDPAILSAGMGLDNIIGLPDLTKEVVRKAGGSWYSGLKCTSGKTPDTGMLTSAAAAGKISQGYKGYAGYDDGLPVVFSWPVATETADPADFQFTLNTGATVFGHAPLCLSGAGEGTACSRQELDMGESQPGVLPAGPGSRTAAARRRPRGSWLR